MKKIIIIVLLVIFNTDGFAQKDFCGKMYYTLKKNMGVDFSQNYLMTFNKTFSYSEEINILKTEKEIKFMDEENMGGSTDRTKVTFIGRKNITPMFYYNNKGKLFFRENFLNNIMLVKETKKKWDWTLIDKTKKIGNFNCQKATINFRGRKYIAWYSTEIPVNFGPWKFQGLPGLILELYDEDKAIHIIANSINISYDKKCLSPINEKDLENALSIKEYLDKREKLINAQFEKMASRMPKGFKAPKWEKDCEDCPKPLEIFDERD
jgi:GLPGLI family protein